MKKCRDLALLFFACAAFFYSCKQPIIDPPEGLSGGLPVNTTVPVPEMESVTNGRAGKIEIKWKTQTNVKKYNVYASRTAFDEAQLIGSSNSGSYEYSVSPGSAFYFSVRSVNKNNEVSTASNKMQGSTLAIPFITGITEDTETDKVTVTWYMEHEDLYGELVTYTVVCKDGDTEKARIQLPPPDKSQGETRENKAVFSGLSHGTYTFTVQASTVLDQDGEISVESTMDTLGWQAKNPIISFKEPVFTKTGNAITSAVIEINTSWEDMGKAGEWDYILKTEQTKPFLSGEERTDAKIEVITDLSAASIMNRTFDFTKALSGEGAATVADIKKLRGYYKWTFYVVEKGTTDLSDESKILVEAESQEVLITDVELTYPQVDIVDGYCTKAVVNWVNEAGISYELGREETDAAGKPLGDMVILNMGTTGSYTDTLLEPGKNYRYTVSRKEIYPSGDEVVTKTMKNSATLGEVVPNFDENTPSQEKIIVTWPRVQKADRYKVTLSRVEDENQKASWIVTDDADFDGADSNAEIKEDDNLFTFTMHQPMGYNDPTLSGKKLNLNVQAYSLDSSNVMKDSSNAGVFVHTLGPANNELRFEDEAEIKAEEINISWNSVLGAKKYLIRRTRFEMDGTTAAEEVILTKDAPNAVGGRITYKDSYKLSYDKLVWGYPFRYEVFPVEDDVDTINATKVPSSVSNDVNIMGYTRGFGLAVKAQKSESNEKVKIDWNKPYKADEDGRTPFIWARKYEKTASGWMPGNRWENVTEKCAAEQGDWYFTPSAGDEAGAWDFAVTYTDTSKPSAQYAESIAVQDANGEAQNKGYIFALKVGFTAENIPDVLDETKPGFGEKYSWDPATLWDFNQRKVGPADYELGVLNNDYGAKPAKIALLATDGTITPDGDGANVTVTPDGQNTVIVEPKDVTRLDGDENNNAVIYEGALKVLRDYRHYPYISAKRTNAAGDEITMKNSTPTVYAYRNITDGELVRMGMLTMTYGIYMSSGGNENYSENVSKVNGGDTGEGSFVVSGGNYVATLPYIGKYIHNLTSIDYAPQMLGPGNKTSSVVKMNIENSADVKYEFYQKGINENFYCLKDILVMNVNSISNEIPYTGLIVLTFNKDKKIGITLTRDGVEKNIVSNSADYLYWFPIRHSSDSKWHFTDSAYYWW